MPESLPAGRLRVLTESGIGAATLVVSLTTVVSHSFGRSTYGLLLPAIEDSLGLSHTASGFGGTALFTAYLVGVVLVAVAAPHTEPITLLRIGLATAAVGLGLNSVATNTPTLYAGLALAGGSGAGIWITAPTLVTLGVAERWRGMTIGLLAATIGAGSFVLGVGTNIFRNAIGDQGAWRPIWAAQAVLTAALLLATFLFVRPERTEPVPGGFSMTALRTIPGWGLITLAYAMFAVVGGGFTAFVVTALEEDGGLSRPQTALVFAAMGLMGAVGAPLTGRFSDRLGRRPLMMSSIAVIALAAFLVAVGEGPLIVVAAIAFGAQAGSFPSVLAAYVRDHVDDRAFSRAFATMMLFFSITAILGPVIIGALADATGSFRVPYLFLTAAALVTFVSVSLLPREPG